MCYLKFGMRTNRPLCHIPGKGRWWQHRQSIHFPGGSEGLKMLPPHGAYKRGYLGPDYNNGLPVDPVA